MQHRARTRLSPASSLFYFWFSHRCQTTSAGNTALKEDPSAEAVKPSCRTGQPPGQAAAALLDACKYHCGGSAGSPQANCCQLSGGHKCKRGAPPGNWHQSHESHHYTPALSPRAQNYPLKAARYPTNSSRNQQNRSHRLDPNQPRGKTPNPGLGQASGAPRTR